MKVVRIILSLFLASLVLVSSTRFTVGIHFCMGEARDIALFADGQNIDCAMEQRLPPCHRQQHNSCCDDETIVHDSQNFNLAFSEDHAKVGSAVVTIQLPVPIRDVIPSSPSIPDYSFADHPPLPIPDLVVEHRVFLI
ncbi:MAG TPA: hypothetical protein VF191_04815 [Cyclobacteriaceae bacterium]